jgi:hypothetical protein
MSGEANKLEKSRERQALQDCRPVSQIEDSSFLTIVDQDVDFNCSSVTDVRFASNSCPKELHSFSWCGSLRRIEIPRSVEIISSSAFSTCSGLSELVFPSDSCLRDLQGFHKCTSLHRVEIPRAVEIIDGFNECSSLQELIIPEESRITTIKGFKLCILGLLTIPPSVTRLVFTGRGFLVYFDDHQLKRSRRRLHLCRP